VPANNVVNQIAPPSAAGDEHLYHSSDRGDSIGDDAEVVAEGELYRSGPDDELPGREAQTIPDVVPNVAYLDVAPAAGAHGEAIVAPGTESDFETRVDGVGDSAARDDRSVDSPSPQVEPDASLPMPQR
jgi:hypothetical protein